MQLFCGSIAKLPMNEAPGCDCPKTMTGLPTHPNTGERGIGTPSTPGKKSPYIFSFDGFTQSEGDQRRDDQDIRIDEDKMG